MSKPPRYTRRRRTPPGTPPGTLQVDPQAHASRVKSIRFDAGEVEESAEILPCQPGRVLWLNIDGLADGALLARIAADFGLHPLAMEDVVSTHQRPKAEEYEAHHFIVLRMPDRQQAPADDRIATEQVAIFLGDGFVITFQERPGDVFDPVRARLRNPRSAIRTRGPDYLCYALIDALLDAYFPVVETLGERLETLEDVVIAESDAAQIGDIHALKHDLMSLRRIIWPMRDMLSTILRDDTTRFSEATRLYLRDAQDHTFQLIDMIETYRDIASGLVDIFLSSQSNRMNEVMKVLTLIATIFIPLTFVAGVYGMNFDYMPELHWRWGYPAVMAAMGVLAVALALWFRSRGWLGRRR